MSWLTMIPGREYAMDSDRILFMPGVTIPRTVWREPRRKVDRKIPLRNPFALPIWKVWRQKLPDMIRKVVTGLHGIHAPSLSVAIRTEWRMFL
ncbi:MAG: hypothetical protein LBO79_07885 [Zoogloeaceae bacterium]|jgi:hypothetical protein|nr:hypothetical protein [Zoogloeaceae bacterium]